MVRCVAKALAPSSQGAEEDPAGALESGDKDEGDVADGDVGIVVLTEDDADETDELAVIGG